MKPLPLGKLKPELLEALLRLLKSGDPRVIVGPQLGEDAAVLEVGDRYLVVSTDPITFAAEEIGWYAVHVNANDVATRGARPRWFQAAVLLPEGRTTPATVEGIYRQIDAACAALGAVVVGGHTEVAPGLERPLVVGTMLGEVAKDHLVTTSGARVGDRLILTKGIVIEGTAILARERRDELLERGFDADFLERARDYLRSPGLSVVREALLASELGVHAMHDPTEGGLAMGLYEMMAASGTGALVEAEAIPLLPEAHRLCQAFGLDPLRTITSGSLLIAAEPACAERLMARFAAEGLTAAVIGQVRERAFGLKLKRGGRLSDLKFSQRDEIAKLF